MAKANEAALLCRRVLTKNKRRTIINYVLMIGALPAALLLVVMMIYSGQQMQRERFEKATTDRERERASQPFLGPTFFIFPLIFIGATGLFVVNRFRRIQRDRALLESAPFAAYGPPKAILAEAIDDLEKHSVKVGRLYMSEHLLADPDPLNIWRYDDLVWVFFEPNEECLVMKCEKQDNTRLPMDEESATAIAAELKVRAPWIHAGYTGELAQRWKASSRNFTEEVALKRRTFSRAMPQES